MKTTNCKGDGKRYEHPGTKRAAGVPASAYGPSDGETGHAPSKDDGGGSAPFTDKLSVEAAGVKRYGKILRWWKSSNRWKHLLFAVPLGAVCGAHFTAGVGLGMEVKDHLYGGKADLVDFALTAAGGAVGHGVMLAVGLDYATGYLIDLIF